MVIIEKSFQSRRPPHLEISRRNLNWFGFDKDLYPRPNNTNDNYLDYYIGVYNGAVADDDNSKYADGT